ncbi:MAG TPA: alpha/beta hydrolase [Anaerolineales bacterium]|jgi:fermentation-respiration switch protein FrsA (DUF1100 family)
MTARRLRPVSFYLSFFAVTVLVTVLGLLLLSAVLIATALTVPLKFPLCCQTPASFGAQYESINFTTADGLTISGWYVPPKNGAVIILLHSYYADRRQTLPVAAMLHQAGYGLLMYDQRASGESEGGSRSLGWRDIPDLRQAAAWINTHQADLKIGAYGCSMGGAIALAGSAGVPSIRAVAADAPSALQWYENLPAFSLQDPLSLPVMALYYPLVILRAQALPPTSTFQAIQDFGPRPLLFISTGRDAEFTRVQAYFEAARGHRQHWNIPEADHCSGPASQPQAYQQHLLDFFNSSLR